MKTMDDRTTNIIRNTAHEIIIRLMDGRRLGALTLLEQHATAAIAEVKKRSASPSESRQLQQTKTAKQIEEEIKAVESTYAHVLCGSLATIQINAPRAIMQVTAVEKLRALYWVLGKPFKHKFTGEPNI